MFAKHLPAMPRWTAPVLLPALCFVLLSGCKSGPAPASDATLTSSLNRQLSQDAFIAGQPVIGSVQGGVATLTGNVATDAQKVIAARDAAGIAGVNSVVNHVAVASQTAISTTTSATPTEPIPVAPLTPIQTITIPATRIPTTRTPATKTESAKPSPLRNEPVPLSTRTRVPAPIERDSQQAYLPPPVQRPTPAPVPAGPAFREVTLAAGATLPVRITQTLDSASTQAGDSFSGVVASDVLVDGLVAIPAGASVSGHVDAVQEAAHFKGSSLLTVSLSSVRVRGGSQPVSSEPYSVQGKGRGKNTAIKTGVGAAVGAVLGGIFGGGKGAAIGAAAGGGAGAGVNGITRGEQVQIPSESVVRFQTTSSLTVRVRTDGSGGRPSDTPNLQPRQNQ